ncbi:MAG: hypothetical protein JW904_07645 [Spirochaetales bacterium]|nr:hypothetical protein [Spirochaetales bacterium]
MPEKQKELLLKEIRKLLPKCDTEGLVFLIKQAHTIIYNLHIDEMNKSLAKVEKMQPAKGRRRTAKPAAADEEKGGVRVEEAPGGKSFIIVLGTMRKVFSRVELQRLVAIAQAPAVEGDHAERLYSWFQKHRGDVLFDGRIGARRHPLLKNLARYLRSHYKVKK